MQDALDGFFRFDFFLWFFFLDWIYLDCLARAGDGEEPCSRPSSRPSLALPLFPRLSGLRLFLSAQGSSDLTSLAFRLKECRRDPTPLRFLSGDKKQKTVYTKKTTSRPRSSPFQVARVMYSKLRIVAERALSPIMSKKNEKGGS